MDATLDKGNSTYTFLVTRKKDFNSPSTLSEDYFRWSETKGCYEIVGTDQMEEYREVNVLRSFKCPVHRQCFEVHLYSK